MRAPVCSDVVVYICRNCIPEDARLPRQWQQDGAHVRVQEIPCSGKTDAQYLLHAIEGGARGICVVACPKGECRLAQGNYRAEIRISTTRRLLAEIGLEPERAELVRSSADDPSDRLERLVREAAQRVSSLGEIPLRHEPREASVEAP